MEKKIQSIKNISVPLKIELINVSKDSRVYEYKHIYKFKFKINEKIYPRIRMFSAKNVEDLKKEVLRVLLMQIKK